MKQVWVYDLETFANCHTGTFKSITTGEIKEFVIHPSRNDLPQYIKFLKTECKGMIGFNNLNYDYPLIHFVLQNEYQLANCNDPWARLYKKSQNIIQSKFSAVKEWQVKIPQLDLYKINHYDNKNKRTSLKWVEFTLRWHNVQDLLFKHDHVVQPCEISDILKYNLNDVEATEMFYKYCKPQIDLRKNLTKIYGQNLMNKSDSAIGVEILTAEYEKLSGINRRSFEHLRDNTEKVYLDSVINKIISFESPELQDVLNDMRLDSRNLINEDYEKVFDFAGCNYTIAKGGLHSNLKGIYVEEDHDHVLIDMDFGSFYPKIMLNLNIYPPQLGKEFLVALNDLTERRLKAKADGDVDTAYSLKITINSIYGNLGNEFSFTYSPQSMYKVTINGQLMIMMLIEKLHLAGINCFYANTDGATFKVNRALIDDFYRICAEFEKYVNIPMEFANYKMCAIRDVNNYIIKTEDKVKMKGEFEIDKFPHKNNSQLVVAKALYNYYINGKPVEPFVKACDDIFDFCKGAKMKSDYQLVARTFNGMNFVDTELTKTTRYYVSNEGVTLIKIMPPLEKETETDKQKRLANQMSIFDVIEDEFVVESDRESNLESGYKCTVYNKHDPNRSYDINYDYYINETYKIINSINNVYESKQHAV